MERIVVQIKEGESGVWFATCETGVGFFIAGPSLETTMQMASERILSVIKARNLENAE